MAKRRAKGPRRPLITDERVPKLLGVLFLLLAFYLFVAFTSYLFTWEEDQDKVFRFTWGELVAGNYEMANWLGRLGAIVSNGFFYWGFGLASYLFVYLLGLYGWSEIKRDPTFKLQPVLRTAFIVLVLLSIFLGFVFMGFEFPFGGAFGQVIAEWMTGFIGVVGMVALFLFSILGFLLWYLNPDLNETTPREVVEDLRNRIMGVFNRRYRTKRPEPTPEPVALRPANAAPKLSAGNKLNPNRGDKPKPALQIEPGDPKAEQGKLDFQKIKDEHQRNRPASLKTGDATLEIEVAPPKVEEVMPSASAPPQARPLRARTGRETQRLGQRGTPGGGTAGRQDRTLRPQTRTEPLRTPGAAAAQRLFGPEGGGGPRRTGGEQGPDHRNAAQL